MRDGICHLESSHLPSHRTLLPSVYVLPARMPATSIQTKADPLASALRKRFIKAFLTDVPAVCTPRTAVKRLHLVPTPVWRRTAYNVDEPRRKFVSIISKGENISLLLEFFRCV